MGDLLSAAPPGALGLVIEASLATEGGTALPDWVTARPLVLASATPFTTIDNATLSKALVAPGSNETLYVAASEVIKA